MLMTLDEYLRNQNISDADFAERIGVSNAKVVHRYRKRQRIPRPGIMHRIQEVTFGAVTPADFYAAE